MEIAVVGLGLIGGSIAKAIQKYTPHTVLGLDTDSQVLYKASLLDAIDAKLTEERLAICDWLIIATRPKAAVEFVRAHASQIRKGAIVMDVCGVKRCVCDPLWQLAEQNGFTFIGGHPMAGREVGGFDHASADLFKDASMIVTPPKGVDIALLEKLKKFWCSIGFGGVTVTTPENHDRVIAYTSQLAHIVSSAYIKSPTALDHIGFSAGSYKDLTRVARLDPDMWTELFLENREPLLSELEMLMDRLQAYREALSASDEAGLRTLLAAGRDQKLEADRKDYHA
ncbi:MAG TPA: prephenate dehydrogenase [Candidatus Limiplasma sp.]|nr:prephenate dehydrogenase [Candidatus Limiplasma sp.]HPS80957.1 prephenate dehydrogenase [Candidatus Limiplasma sp.]